MNRWCAQGRLVRRGHGVYKLSKWIATPYDSFAEAVAQVGQEAYLWGDAVLAMHNLALVDPPTIKVATPKRVRKELPPWVEVIHRPARAAITYYEGIPAQRVGDVLRTCKNAIMPERLWSAVMEAKEKGLITAEEYQEFRRELNASKL